MFNFNVEDKCVVLVAGIEAPGIVTDPVVKPRRVIVSRTRDPRGYIELPESIVVLSLRTPPNGPEFLTERAEVAAFVGPRIKAHAIDKKSLTQLRMEVFQAMADLQKRRRAEADGQTDAAAVPATA